MTVLVGVALRDVAILATDSRAGTIHRGRGDVIQDASDDARKLIPLTNGYAAVSGFAADLREMFEYEDRPVEALTRAWRKRMEMEATRDHLNTWRNAGHDLVPTLLAVHHEDGELGLLHLADGPDPALNGNVRIIAPPDMDEVALNDLTEKLFQGLSNPDIDRKIEALRDFFQAAYAHTDFAGGPVQIGIIRRTAEGWKMEDMKEEVGAVPV